MIGNLTLDVFYMHMALQEASRGYALQEVPVGALVVQQGKVIGRGFNQPIGLNDPTAHAELQAIRHAAQQIQNYRLADATLYVTIEPCTMCLGAIVHARINRVVFGALEPKAGRLCSHSLVGDACFNQALSIEGGVCAEQAGALMQRFFAERRALQRLAKTTAC